jgi:hypothetical protein
MVVDTEAHAFETVSETICPFLELSMGESRVPPHHDLTLGDTSGNALVEIGQIELHFHPLPILIDVSE